MCLGLWKDHIPLESWVFVGTNTAGIFLKISAWKQMKNVPKVTKIKCAIWKGSIIGLSLGGYLIGTNTTIHPQLTCYIPFVETVIWIYEIYRFLVMKAGCTDIFLLLSFLSPNEDWIPGRIHYTLSARTAHFYKECDGWIQLNNFFVTLTLFTTVGCIILTDMQDIRFNDMSCKSWSWLVTPIQLIKSAVFFAKYSM